MKTHFLKYNALALLASTLAIGQANAGIILSGTVRDFCAPDISGVCTRLSDFEGAIPGVVTGMVESTLTGGLPKAVESKITAGASTTANFAKWYTDSLGFNQSAPISLPLTETSPGSGIYKYANSAFFPIDGQLFDNQGRSHNYHFTMHLEGLLSFDDPTVGADKSFSFTGDDDLWVFVDGKLVIDLGGVHPAASASFTEETLKSLGLVAGTDYALDIFFAERHTTESNFNITTSLTIAPIPPTGVPEPATLVLLGIGLAGLSSAGRRSQSGVHA